MRAAHGLQGALDVTPLRGPVAVAPAFAGLRILGRLRDCGEPMLLERLARDGMNLRL